MERVHFVRNHTGVWAGMAVSALLWAVPSVRGQQNPPPASPPAAPSTPAPGTPASGTPAPGTPAPGTPAPGAPASGAQTPANPVPAAPHPEPQSSLYGPWFVEAVYWLPSAQPDLRGGRAATAFSDLDYPKDTRSSPGLDLSIPVSSTGMLRVSAFEMRGSGNVPSVQSVTLFGTPFLQGDLINTTYTITNVKVSLEDLLYPFPRKEGQKFRFKTLWEVQYTNMKSNYSALETDSSGNTTTNTVQGARYVVYPTLGMAVEYNLSPQFKLNVEASGFSIPHHATIWDGGGSLSYRRGRVEVTVGEKAFHFSTSAKSDQFFRTTLLGPYAAVRWYGGKPL